MKNILQFFILINLIFISITFSSCGDKNTTDNLNVNDEIVVLAQADEGILLKEECIVIHRGEDVEFSFEMKTGYHYISNSKDAKCSYDDETGIYTLKFSQVISPFTFYLISMAEDDFYNVELCYDKSKGDVEITGDLFVPFPQEISLKAEPNEGYEFLGFSLFNYLSSHGDLICENMSYTFTPVEKRLPYM